jgi:hypothetical protein
MSDSAQMPPPLGAVQRSPAAGSGHALDTKSPESEITRVNHSHVFQQLKPVLRP